MPNQKPIEEKKPASLSEIESLKQRIAQLEENNQKFRRPERIKEHTSFVAIVKDQPVIKFENNRDKLNMKIKVTLLNGEEEVFDYLQFLNSMDRAKVVIKKQVATERTTSDLRYGGGGQMNKIDLKTGRATGEIIDLEVTSVDYVSTVEIIEGNLTGLTFEIDNKYLNP